MQLPSESDLTPNSSAKGFGYFEEQSAPSTQIDAVICDLIAHIENYSDEDFDSQWMHLTSAEAEAMVVALIRHLGACKEIRPRSSWNNRDIPLGQGFRAMPERLIPF